MADRFFAINGDTFFKVDVKELLKLHQKKNSKLSLCLFETFEDKRYKIIKLNKSGKIIKSTLGNEEKKLVNGGVYLIEKEDFNLKKFNNIFFTFSFEEDYIEKMIFKDSNYLDLNLINLF